MEETKAPLTDPSINIQTISAASMRLIRKGEALSCENTQTLSIAAAISRHAAYFTTTGISCMPHIVPDISASPAYIKGRFNF
ncbi:MAG: hypothetical protein IJR62_07460 [Lachnospiraceae bacterium]|nr:hypothetical protein [Lachnospiraceae bacterium]